MEEFDFAQLADFAKQEEEELPRRPDRYHKYRKEQGIYKDAYNRKVSNAEAELIARKLARHFKLRISIRFWGNRQTGCAYHSGLLRISNNPSVGLIAHEVAHVLDRKRRMIGLAVRKLKSRHGSKRWLKLVGRVLAYGNKHGWWQDEYAKRLEQSQTTAQKKHEKKAQAQTQDAKLERLKANLKRWESKRKRAETAIKKLNRGLKRLQKIRNETAQPMPHPACLGADGQVFPIC